MTVDSTGRILFEGVLGGRNVVRVAEGEDEHVLVRFRGGNAVPRQRSVSTKEMVVARADDCECGSSVVTMLVKVGN